MPGPKVPPSGQSGRVRAGHSACQPTSHHSSLGERIGWTTHPTGPGADSAGHPAHRRRQLNHRQPKRRVFDGPVVRAGINDAGTIVGNYTDPPSRRPRHPPEHRRWPGWVVRFARLMHRRVRAFGLAFGRRLLRRRCQPELVATQGDAAEVRRIECRRSSDPRSRWTSHRGPVRYRMPEPE